MYLREKHKVSGYLEFEKVQVFCLLSIDEMTLPKANTNTKNGLRIYRSIVVNREEIEVSTVFTDWHKKSYLEPLKRNRLG